MIAAVVVIAVFGNYLQTKPGISPQPSLTPSISPTLSTSPRPSLSQIASPTPPVTLSSSPSASSPPTPTPLPKSPNPPLSPIFPSGPVPSPSPIILYPGEVREYQGQNLASIGDVYENAIAGTQYIDPANYALSIFGLVNNSLQLSYNTVLAGYKSYQKVVTIYCVQGWNATILWEGVLVKDLLQSAGAQSGANTVIFYASDGYSTALPLSYVTSNNIILAYNMNGLVIPPERGFPFELVAESKYGYKWIKWVTAIELSNDASYLGYWESRGDSNDATVP